MSGFLASALTSVGAEVDFFAPALGITSQTVRLFDAGITAAADAANDENLVVLVADALATTLIVAAIGPEVLAGVGTAIVGEEAIAGAVWAVDEAIATLVPAAASLTSGTEIVGQAASVLGGLVVGANINAWLVTASDLYSSPQSVAVSQMTNQDPNGSAEVVIDGGSLSITQTFNTILLPTETDVEYSDGSSQIVTSYSDGSSTTVTYSGRDGAGAILGILLGGPPGGPGSGNLGDPAAPLSGGGGAGAAENQLATANVQISPLVLDLTGSGINLTPLSPTSPYFDLTGNGFARKTGWTGAGTGFLVLPNNSGQVTSITQLFGDYPITPNGFSALGFYDHNSDGTISSADPVFSQLRVWVDSNSNGVVDPGELYTLAELGIVSINLSPTSVDETVAGNTIKYVSTYTLADGTQREIADAYFSNSPTFTQPDIPITVPGSIAALPQLNGYGIMYNLHSAMTTDTTLLGLVQTFAGLSASTAASTIQSDVRAIMYEWAGVTSFTANYGIIDPREAVFLSHYTGQPYGYSEFSAPRQSDDINQGWTDAFDAIEARLVLQSPLAAEVPEFTYDQSADFVLPATNLYAAFASAFARLGNVTASNLSSWSLFDQVAYAFQLDAHISQAAYEAAIDSATNDTIASVANAVANDIQVTFDGNGDIVETGVDLGSTFYAGPDISTLVGEGAGAVPSGAAGQGWQITHDTYNYNVGDGAVEIDGQGYYQSTSNTLAFGPGILASQVTASQGSGNNVILTVDAAGDQMTLDDMIARTYDGGLYQAQFADGTVWTAQYIDSLVIATGSPTLTRLVDTLGGATFTPNGYAHFAEGAGDGDTFLYDEGDGNLEIDERDSSSSANDVLILGAGILPSQVVVSCTAIGGIALTLSSSATITLDDMASQLDFGVQQVEFANGTSWSEGQILTLATTGSPGNTSLNSNHPGTVFDFAGYAHYASCISLYGNDIFLYNMGYGNVEISDDDSSSTPNDILKFGTGISPSGVSVSGNAIGGVVLTLGGGGEVTFDRMSSNAAYGVQQVEFSDGTSWTQQQILTMETTGSPGNTSLYSDRVGTTFDPAGYAHYVSSLSLGGDDVFLYNVGYGNLEISNLDNAATPDDVLKVGVGISPSSIVASTNAIGGVVLTLAGGGKVTLDHMVSHSNAGVQQVEFADGTSWTRQQVVAAATAAPCFLRGSRLVTPRGEVQVENLKVGDLVRVRSNGFVPIKWIGRRRIDCHRHPNPQLVRPIRIAAHAFGPGQPCRVLWLSPDHAVYVKDLLVPIKLLVNGATIRQETGMRHICYFHVELERHDILIADGLFTESYLDTGNRNMFENDGASLVLYPNMSQQNDQARREAESCVPLACDAARVEPIWRSLAARAEELGFCLDVTKTTGDPELYIEANGTLHRPIIATDHQYTFVIRKLCGDGRLVSRSVVPSAIHPWIDDSRCLGVAVHRLTARYGGEHIDFAMDDPCFVDGWWDAEAGDRAIWRWTKGSAHLPIAGDFVVLDVLIGGALRYPIMDCTLHADLMTA